MILTDQQIAPIDVEKRRKSGFDVGDTVRVHQKITEKDKIRIQVFEGTVIARKHGTEPGATFTVRRVGTDGIVVEKIFPLYTPTIDRIEISQKIKTRRAKLYFLRGRTPKQIREKLRNTVASIKDAVVPEPRQQEKTKEGREVQQHEGEEGSEKQPTAQQEDLPEQEKEEEVEKQPTAQQDEQQKQGKESASKQQEEVPKAQSDVHSASESEQTKQTATPQQPGTTDA